MTTAAPTLPIGTGAVTIAPAPIAVQTAIATVPRGASPEWESARDPESERSTECHTASGSRQGHSWKGVTKARRPVFEAIAATRPQTLTGQPPVLFRHSSNDFLSSRSILCQRHTSTRLPPLIYWNQTTSGRYRDPDSASRSVIRRRKQGKHRDDRPISESKRVVPERSTVSYTVTAPSRRPGIGEVSMFNVLIAYRRRTYCIVQDLYTHGVVNGVVCQS